MISNIELDSFIEKFNYLPGVAKKLKVIDYTENDFLKFSYEGESERTSIVDSEGYLVNSPDTRLLREYYTNVSLDSELSVKGCYLINREGTGKKFKINGGQTSYFKHKT